MLTKLLCFLLGHKIWIKSIKEDKAEYLVFEMQLSERCLRCGKQLKNSLK